VIFGRHIWLPLGWRYLCIGIVVIATVAAGRPAAALECIESQEKRQWPLNVDQPSDMAVGPKGDLYLVDGVNHRVVVVDPQGRVRFNFGSPGSGRGEMQLPLGIDIAGRRVYVADSGNHRIQVFDLQGRFEFQFEVPAASGEKPSDPVDVLATGLKNRIYVADNDNHKIKVFDQKGHFQTAWGGYGEENGEFRYPAMLAVNSANELLVVDVLNTRVQKFDPFGNYLTEIGSWGVTPGKLMRPKGVSVDDQDRVYISDSYMGVVQVFTDQGRLLGVVCNGGAINRLETPMGLVAAPDGKRLHVVEMRANRIRIFELKQ